MKTRIAFGTWLLVGCTFVHELPVSPEAVEAREAADVEWVTSAPSLADLFDGSDTGIAFVNPPSVEGSRDLMAGVSFAYARGGSANARSSPVDIRIHVEDIHGNPLHQDAVDRVTEIYQQIYGWDPAVWQRELEGRPEAADVLIAKSNSFWELLAQQVAERVFEMEITPALLVYGPECVDAEGLQHCETAGIDAAQRVVVRTSIDGSRDLLNPASRTIVYVAERDRLRDPEILLEVRIPTGLHVAGPEGEHLDFRPRVGETRDWTDQIRVFAHLPAGTRERVQNTDYPDYNLLFVPLRHLVFQGLVDDPKGPAASLFYPDQAALRARFDAVISDLRNPESAAGRVNGFCIGKY